MFDIWAFLLQTLTASGVALLLLAVKSMFRDKLPPKWHFAIWGILGLSLLLPAGLGGRHVLFNWPLAVETLKSLLTEEYTFTKVYFPFPAFRLSIPQTIAQWTFVLYLLGVVFHLLKYAVSYIHLRAILRRGWETDAALTARIRALADQQQIPLCQTVTVPGLPSAFVCGVFRPILALPADIEIDEKVMLHELLHLKSRDTVWSLVICLLRSIHWCNPLLVYCANQAGNDLEARCDQRVLELLEGEARRDYGRILLSMSNDQFARTPGSTCVNNGGKNIRSRIEAIARFKRYPAGMRLVSICAAIILGLPMILGVKATEVHELDYTTPAAMAFASARTTYCSTPAGAFDAYGKAVLDMNGIYRIMCAPEAMQKELTEAILSRHESGKFPNWIPMEDFWPNVQTGYYIYNLEKMEDAYEGLLVIERNYPPDFQPEQEGMMYLAVQMLRVERENGRWVTIPLEDFRNIEVKEESISWGCEGLPAYHYTGTASNFLFDVRFQSVYEIDNTEIVDQGWFFGTTTSYDLVPKPDAAFSTETWHHSYSVTHLGTQSQRDEISRVCISLARVMEGEERPALFVPGYQTDASGTSTQGSSWSSRNLEPGWGPVLRDLGGGSKYEADPDDTELPAYYAVALYINDFKTSELDLTLEEGGPR